MDESVVRHLEQQQQKTVTRLSEAVRVGSRLRGECHQWWAHDGGSCALVAACEATGMDYENNVFTSSTIYPHLRRAFPGVPHEVMGAVPSLMDSDGYTREQVADWLEAQGY